jgi:hypothetical protein
VPAPIILLASVNMLLCGRQVNWLYFIPILVELVYLISSFSSKDISEAIRQYWLAEMIRSAI